MLTGIKAFSYIAIRLPSDSIKIEHVSPGTTISLGKFGSFNTNSIIGRPFHLTFEILDRADQSDGRQLRVVTAAELHADTLLEEAEAEANLQDGATPNPELDEYGVQPTEKSNVAIYDNPENQKLTMREIEALKNDESGSAKDLIARLLASHSQLDQKTAFSLAKYTLRKQKKYMKRFTVLPLDVTTLTEYIQTEKDSTKIMELRNEALALIGSWSNVHASELDLNDDGSDTDPQSRYLVVDDTGGLLVAALAERMGILHNDGPTNTSSDRDQPSTTATQRPDQEESAEANDASAQSTSLRRHKRHYYDQLATSSTLTVIHSNQQPNLSLLRYFGFDPNLPPAPSTPDPHPLHSHLRTLTWLQLLEPDADSTYIEPPRKTPEELYAMKSNARSTYYRKRRRWEKCRSIVDETRCGGFNGLIVASHTDPTSILHRLVPLLAGGAQIVVYSPHIEPLLSVADAYSTAHRAAFLGLDDAEREAAIGTEKFPVDPTLALGVMVQTARVRRWQVLPGRTHPLMTSKGGAEGYIASATRVLPVKGKIEARGKQGRSRSKKKAEEDVVIVKDEEAADSSDEAEENEKKRLKVEDDSTLAHGPRTKDGRGRREGRQAII